MKIRFFAGLGKFSVPTRPGATGIVDGVIVETG